MKNIIITLSLLILLVLLFYFVAIPNSPELRANYADFEQGVAERVDKIRHNWNIR